MMKIHGNLTIQAPSMLSEGLVAGVTELTLEGGSTSLDLTGLSHGRLIILGTTLSSHILELTASESDVAGENFVFVRDPAASGFIMIKAGSSYYPLEFGASIEAMTTWNSSAEDTKSVRIFYRQWYGDSISGTYVLRPETFVTIGCPERPLKTFYADETTSFQGFVVPNEIHGCTGQYWGISTRILALDGTLLDSTQAQVLWTLPRQNTNLLPPFDAALVKILDDSAIVYPIVVGFKEFVGGPV
jgi:hypothetical protein